MIITLQQRCQITSALWALPSVFFFFFFLANADENSLHVGSSHFLLLPTNRVTTFLGVLIFAFFQDPQKDVPANMYSTGYWKNYTYKRDLSHGMWNLVTVFDIDLDVVSIACQTRLPE